jgi:phosphate transport system protein
MGLSAEELLQDSMKALTEGDRPLSERVRSRRPALSREFGLVEKEIYTFIAMHQPLPYDLEKIACTLSFIASMDRICRLGDAIAEAVIARLAHISWAFVLKAFPLQCIADEAISMVHDTLTAFGAPSKGQIGRHAERNDHVKAMEMQVLRAGVEWCAREPRDIHVIEQVLLVTRALADSAANSTSIAEKIRMTYSGEGRGIPSGADRSP